MREMFLDSLPPDAPGKIRELQDYRFVDPQAQQMFDELMEHLREQVMGAYFRSMAEGMKNITPEQLAHFRDMLAELNQMIEQRARGDEYDFDGFMERYGDLFPDNPRSLDELLENMARRMAAMSRLMASLSPEQRCGAPGTRRAGDAGHGPGVRDEPPGFEPAGRVPGHAVGRADHGRRRRRRADAAVGDGRRDGAHARLRGPGPRDARRLPGRDGRRRRRGGAPADPGRAGRPRPPPAQGGRARAWRRRAS